jgi:hypothetical protein
LRRQTSLELTVSKQPSIVMLIEIETVGFPIFVVIVMEPGFHFGTGELIQIYISRLEVVRDWVFLSGCPALVIFPLFFIVIPMISEF